MINIGLLEDEALEPGDWVLIHVGFAMSKIDEDEAAVALASLKLMGSGLDDEMEMLGRDGAMKFVDEYRDPVAVAPRARRDPELAGPSATTSSWRCAAATPTRSTATASSTCCPHNVELVHGPGCPVCVIPMGRIDDAIAVAETPDVIFTSFGDMMRVPGGNGTLLEAKARGADVRFVYSPARRPEGGGRQPRPAGRVLRRRLRDHGALHRRHAASRRATTRS